MTTRRITKQAIRHRKMVTIIKVYRISSISYPSFLELAMKGLFYRIRKAPHQRRLYYISIVPFFCGRKHGITLFIASLWLCSCSTPRTFDPYSSYYFKRKEALLSAEWTWLQIRKHMITPPDVEIGFCKHLTHFITSAYQAQAQCIKELFYEPLSAQTILLFTMAHSPRGQGCSTHLQDRTLLHR